MSFQERKSDVPHPVHGDDVGPHPADSEDHVIEQIWFHKARDLSENDTSDVDFEYHHSEPIQRIQSTSNDNAVIYSDHVVNLDRIR